MSQNLRRLQKIASELLSRNRFSYFSKRHSSNTSDVASYTGRTNLCGSLQSHDVGKNVRLCGWVHHKRMSGYFLLLRDWQGETQLVLEKPELTDVAAGLPYESVIEVEGTVRPRIPGQENKNMTTGEVEVVVDKVTVLNKADGNLPFQISKPIQVNEAMRMEYRYLDIRTNKLQRNLRLRSKMIMKMREFLANNHEFVDVETPNLFRRTPGGAKEFVVPSHFPGKFYSLPQSPQQFKQLLMVGGIDRYFQIAKCFRDEGSKPDRQPEFTQNGYNVPPSIFYYNYYVHKYSLDLEMSFVDREGVLGLVEEMLVHSWPENLPPLNTPFPRLTYQTVMEQYGIDKPDTRFDMKTLMRQLLQELSDLGLHYLQLKDISTHCTACGFDLIEDALQNNGVVIAIRVPQATEHFSNREIKSLLSEVKTVTNITEVKAFSDRVTGTGEWTSLQKINSTVRSAVSKFMSLEHGDLIFLATGDKDDVQTFMGKLRLFIADGLEKKGVEVRDKSGFNFLWVIDFPLFLRKEDGDGLESAHHPFTDAHPEDRHLLHTDPEQVRGQHYDLVLNGNEVGGGSIRIHKSEDQRYVLTNVLKEDSSELNHLLEAFTLGCPPHGGIALGLDRLFAIMTNSQSIRDVIAFPKSSEGKDLMSKAPTNISAEQLAEYHIQVKGTISDSTSQQNINKS